MKVIIVILSVLCGSAFAQLEPFGTEICRLFADGVKLRQPGTCLKYLTCKNGLSTVTDCKGKYYDKEKEKCVSLAPETYCKDPCTTKSPSFVADPKTCEGYYYCVKGKGTESVCLGGLHFDQQKQSCVYESDSTCYGYKYCDIVPNNVPFKHEGDCQKYYTCVKGKLTENVCENGYYHARDGCVKRSEVECLDHPIPVTACGTTKKPTRNKFVNDLRTCRGYFFCKDKGDNTPDPEPSWGQCPADTFFDFKVQGCVHATNVVCEEDRCDGRNREMVISGTPGCQHYLLCNGDQTVREQKCADGMYFDDDKMECSTQRKSYPACS